MAELPFMLDAVKIFPPSFAGFTAVGSPPAGCYSHHFIIVGENTDIKIEISLETMRKKG
jgi:hypothetical protein